MGNYIRGIRGATTVENNTANDIIGATCELLSAMIEQNSVELEDIASTIFTVTSDINAEFPAFAARQMGWNLVPMMGAVEMTSPKGLQKCIRVLIHINTHKRQDEIIHVYLRKAVQLRRDLKS